MYNNLNLINIFNKRFIRDFIFLIKISFFILFSYNFNIKKSDINLDLDNEFPPIYEENINFSNYTSNIKPIALYYPEFNNFNFNYTNKTNINTNQNSITKLKNQIELAKNHGIYGFAIHFIFDFNNKYLDDINIFLEKEIDFPFFLIWKNNNFNNLYNSLNNDNNNNNENKINKIIFKKFAKQINNFIIRKIYIKINNKPILAIENPLIISNKKLLTLRNIFKQNGIDDLYIICPLTNYQLLNRTNQFDAFYDFPKYEILNSNKSMFNIYYYSGIIYKNIKYNGSNFQYNLFRSSLVETNLIPKENGLKFYSLEKFYILNKIIIESTKNNFKTTHGFILLNSWNDYENGNYLEPDKIYGYAALNSFSKALFNLSFRDNNYNNLYLKNICVIAIQAHIFFEDITYEIINKTNNIPVQFDLYVTTVSESKKLYIEQIIQKYSNASKYTINIVENKGRDVLPFITQMKNHYKKYKYICHIHTKKTQKFPITGNLWRKYLYNNLLGSKEIISEILYDFEINDNLGFVFPDTYYNIIKGVKDFESINFKHHIENIEYINFVAERMLKNRKIGNRLIFPSGDMFWAKIDSIHQIFEIKFIKMFPKEIGQLNKTIMHAIERIWLYLVKLNGYFFKTLFKIY